MSATAPILQPALSANTAGGAFAAKVGTATKPSGTGIFDLLSTYLTTGRNGMAKFIQLLPFSKAANNATFDMQLWGWYKTTNETTNKWMPILLVELNVVAGNIAQGDANTFLSDTITIAKGDADASKISPTTNFVGSILVHLRGCELIEFEFDRAGGQEAESCNCYWRLLDQS